MSSKYKFRDNEKLYFVSFSAVYWLDIFIRREYKEVILESIRYCQKEKGLEVYSWCIMTSHIHMIIGSNGNQLSNIMRDFKSFTSTSFKNNIQESRQEWMLWMMERAGKLNKHNGIFQLWQEGNHPVELFDNDIMQQKLDYIHNNPVESGFVDKAEDFLYSSARDYCGIKGLIDIIHIE